MLDILVDNCDLIIKEIVKDKKKTIIYIVPTEKSKLMYNDCVLIGTKLPMLIPPIKWSENVNGGGYLLNGKDYCKPLIHQSVHFKTDVSVIKDKQLYDVINNLQSVGFKINKELLTLLRSSVL